MGRKRKRSFDEVTEVFYVSYFFVMHGAFFFDDDRAPRLPLTAI